MMILFLKIMKIVVDLYKNIIYIILNTKIVNRNKLNQVNTISKKVNIMTNTFVKSLVAEQDKEIKNNNKTITTNGAKAFKSTLNANLDLHSAMGSFRKTNDEKITKLLDEALNEDLDTALRNLLLLRDVRGGLGEREAFRKCLQHLYHANYNVLINSNFLELVPVVGRWDDLLVFINPIYNTEIKQKVANIIKNAICEYKKSLDILNRFDSITEEEAKELLASMS